MENSLKTLQNLLDCMELFKTGRIIPFSVALSGIRL